jgi:phosphatidate cytidylyltransferase
MIVRAARFKDLAVRSLTGVALGAVTLAAVWAGGVWTALLLGIAASLMVWELAGITRTPVAPGVAAMIAMAGIAVLVTEAALLRHGMLVLLAGAALGIWLDRLRSPWLLGGYLWIGLAMCCVEGLRADPQYGFEAVLWLFLVVVASDVGGYFGGRLIGGPKLWPRISPKKTWAGSLTGMALAATAGAFFSRWTTGTLVVEVATVSAMVALVSQGGDMLESWIKRRFGAKDSSKLLPGHGGVLDRLDGLMAAALVSAVITFARGRSVFVW